MFKNSGQTLIETLVAIFILVMGITSAVGLAIFSYGSSTNVTKQIIAVGLAREGIEAFKNMRDTNWLKSASISSCYNWPASVTAGSDVNNATCYNRWIRRQGGPSNGYDIYEPGSGHPYRLTSDMTNSSYWQTKDSNNNWGLDFDSDIASANFKGFYKISNINSGVLNGSSDYYRQVVVREDATPPFDRSNMPRLVVESRVWWADKNCPRTAIYPGLGKCSVSFKTHLTNWKDY